MVYAYEWAVEAHIHGTPPLLIIQPALDFCYGEACNPEKEAARYLLLVMNCHISPVIFRACLQAGGGHGLGTSVPIISSFGAIVTRGGNFSACTSFKILKIQGHGTNYHAQF